MKVFKNSFRKSDQSSKEESSKSLTKAKFFDSIEEISIYNWQKVVDTGDLKWIVIEDGETTEKEAVNAWHTLQDQWIVQFGNSKSWKDIITLKHEIWMLYAEYLETGNQDIEMEADLLMADYLEMKTKEIKADFYKEKAKLDIEIGFRVDPKSTSVVEYFSYLNDVSNGR
jgi:hypothetical protein